MQIIYLSLVFILSISTLFSQNENQFRVTVNLENIQSNEGSILLALHTKASFNSGTAFNKKMIKANKETQIVTFDSIPSGSYAVIVLHDINNNKKMDFELNGMPKEPYTSSSIQPLFGPPNFENSRFELQSESITLNLRF